MLIKPETTTTEGEKKEKKKGRKIHKQRQNMSKCKNTKCFSWLSAVSVLSLTGCHSPSRLSRVPSNLCWSLDLLWGQLRLLSGPTPVCSCLQCPQLSDLAHFLLWGLSFYIFTSQSLPSWLCRFSMQLVQLVGRFWVLFLNNIASRFQLWFYLYLRMWVIHRFCSWGCCGRLKSAPVRTRCGGDAAAWITGALASPGTQESWQLGKQEIR